MWYLDCYCHGAIGGRDFPVNSYYHNDLSIVIETAKSILNNKISGIDEIRICKETKGMSVREISL